MFVRYFSVRRLFFCAVLIMRVTPFSVGFSKFAPLRRVMLTSYEPCLPLDAALPRVAWSPVQTKKTQENEDGERKTIER